MSRKVTGQKFGGPWSILKLEAVANYLTAFNIALQCSPSADRPFRRIYIDAFAGSGTFVFGEDEVSLFDEMITAKEHAGSAKRALDAMPAFHELVFIDNSHANIEQLSDLCAGDSRVRIVEGDANQEVARICRSLDWRKYRGVIFLDPFNTAVEWKTLCAIQRTKALDVWYLFPLSGVYRNAPHKSEALTKEKKDAVTRALGTDTWVEFFYKPADPKQHSLFGDASPQIYRSLDVDGIEAFVKERLETIFPRVIKPGRLRGPTNAPMYSLFFAVSNPDNRAITLASRIARNVLKVL